METQVKQKFEETPEAQEYIQKLQEDKVQLPDDANPMEADILKRLKEFSRKIAQMTAQTNQLEKEIVSMQKQKVAMEQDISQVAGEMTGYAKLLVAAEGKRREEGLKSVDGGKESGNPPKKGAGK